MANSSSKSWLKGHNNDGGKYAWRKDAYEPSSNQDHEEHDGFNFPQPIYPSYGHGKGTYASYGHGNGNYPSYGHGQGKIFDREKPGEISNTHDLGYLEPREVNGTGNNQTDPSLGSAGSQLLRLSSPAYSDGAGPLQGPNPRDVSNAILDQDAPIPNSFGASDLFTYFGQFIDHDIDLTPDGDGETIGFNHPDGDFEIVRSGYVSGTGTDASNPLQFPNVITSFVDASNVYGSHAEVTSVLRADGGHSAYLLTSDSGYAPTLGQITSAYPNLDPNNVGGGPLTVGGENPALFVAGDVRANENIALTSLHTVWIREHNYQVDRLRDEHPYWSEDKLFDAAKIIVEAEYQNIVFNEYLPLLLGAENIPNYNNGYDASVNPNVAIEFSAAAYRLGHSQISPTLARRNEDGSESDEGDLPLFQAFFRPDQLSSGGIDALIRGLGAEKGQEIDQNIDDNVRDLLFGGTEQDPIDLGVFNILRGYDQGIPTLNEVRKALSEALDLDLQPYGDFSELTSDADLATQLAQVYDSVDEVELWVGGLAEDEYPGSQLGETFHTIVLDQFMRFRAGDSYYFEERLVDSPELLAEIKATAFSDIILRNTEIDYLQDDAFIAHTRIGGTYDNDKLKGTEDHDLIIGFEGNDRLYGKDGDDDLYGGDNNDKLWGQDGDDVLNGGAGHDVLKGGWGADEIYGDAGNDIIYGGRGDDVIDPGHGRDIITGGWGSDVFVFDFDRKLDRVTDFKDGVDHIGLDGITYDDLYVRDKFGGALVSYHGDRMFLSGLDAAQITEDDFLVITENDFLVT